jgi:hypothetical protein
MELSPYLAALRSDLAAAAAVGTDDVARAAALLGDAVEPALRLVLLDLLTEAADELAGQVPGTAFEVRLRGREPELVATSLESVPAPEVEVNDEGTARLTLRLPETLKTRAETAAASDGVSVNSWLVRAVAAAVEPRASFPFTGSPAGPRRITGFGRA